MKLKMAEDWELRKQKENNAKTKTKQINERVFWILKFWRRKNKREKQHAQVFTENLIKLNKRHEVNFNGESWNILKKKKMEKKTKQIYRTLATKKTGKRNTIKENCNRKYGRRDGNVHTENVNVWQITEILCNRKLEILEKYGSRIKRKYFYKQNEGLLRCTEKFSV